MIKSIINWVRGSAPAPCNQAGDPGWHRAPSIFSSPGSPLTHPPRESILQRQHRHAVNVLRRFAKYTEVLYSGEWETGISKEEEVADATPEEFSSFTKRCRERGSMFSTSDVIIGDIPDYEEEEVFSKTSSLAIFPVQHVFRERIFYHSTEHNFTSLEEAKDKTILTVTGFRRYIRTKIYQEPNPNQTYVVEDPNRTFVVEDHNRTFVVGTDTIEDNEQEETRRATFTVLTSPALNVTFTM